MERDLLDFGVRKPRGEVLAAKKGCGARFYIACLHFDALPRGLVVPTPNFIDGQAFLVPPLCTMVGVFAFPLALLGLQYTRGGTTLFLDICTRNALAKTVCLMICYHGYCIESFVDVS